MSRMLRAVFMAAVFGMGLSGPAPAYETLFEAEVTRVIDGDTFEIEGGDKIRIRNFDTAELRHYDCPEEREMAVVARDVARAWLEGRRVQLFVDGEDRYGRLVADVIVYGDEEMYNFADRMAAAGVGAHWDYGKEPQPDWCPAQPIGERSDGGAS